MPHHRKRHYPKDNELDEDCNAKDILDKAAPSRRVREPEPIRDTDQKDPKINNREDDHRHPRPVQRTSRERIAMTKERKGDRCGVAVAGGFSDTQLLEARVDERAQLPPLGSPVPSSPGDQESKQSVEPRKSDPRDLDAPDLDECELNRDDREPHQELARKPNARNVGQAFGQGAVHPRMLPPSAPPGHAAPAGAPTPPLAIFLPPCPPAP